jgi:hypothetical protein
MGGRYEKSIQYPGHAGLAGRIGLPRPTILQVRKFISQFSAYYPVLDRTAGLSCFRFFVISFGLEFIDRQST